MCALPVLPRTPPWPIPTRALPEQLMTYYLPPLICSSVLQRTQVQP